MNKLQEALVVVAVCVGAGAFIAAPELVHVLDRGFAQASLDELPTRHLETRNVALEGVIIEELAVDLTETRTKNGDVTSRRFSKFYPLVASDWQAGQPVHVVVHAVENDITRLTEQLAQGSHVRVQGVIRNVAWEGLNAKVRAEYERGGQPLADDVMLLELGTPNDAMWAAGLPLAGLLLALVVVSQRRRESHPVASAPV